MRSWVAVWLTLCLVMPGSAGYAQSFEEWEKKNTQTGDWRSHWFVGLGVGSTLLEPEGESAGFVIEENNSTGSKIYFGQKIKPRWSWEISHLDAGSAELTNPNPIILAATPDPKIEYTVTSAFAHYYLKGDDARLNWFAKFGLSSISTTASESRIELISDSSTQLAFGFGAQLRFGSRWLLRVEHDNHAKDATFTGVSIGLKLGDTWQGYVPKVKTKQPKKPKKRKPVPVVIEYPLYIPDEQAVVLAEDRATVLDVADDINKVSAELMEASLRKSTSLREAQHLAKQAELLTDSSERIAVVEESILKTKDVDVADIDLASFVNDKGQKLLATPAEQSSELKVVRQNIGKVERSVGDIPNAQERLRGVRGRIAVVEESLLFVPPWEEAKAAKLCNDMTKLEKQVIFRSESSRFVGESKAVLDNIAQKMNQNPRIILEVHAHTDSWGTFAFNNELSARRAQRAVDYLVSKGVVRARLIALGFGETKPIAPNNTDAGRTKNRRIEFVIKNPNICERPG